MSEEITPALRAQAAKIRLALLDARLHPDIPGGQVMEAKRLFEGYVAMVDALLAGFSQEDVALLRFLQAKTSEDDAGGWIDAWLELRHTLRLASLASRISALLPPEEK